MAWLTQVPIAVVSAHVAMLPRLQAEESLRDVTRIALASGNVKEADQRRIRGEWERVARGGKAPRARKATPHDLKGLGIGLRRVPKVTSGEAHG